jgi:hypothetical protein
VTDHLRVAVQVHGIAEETNADGRRIVEGRLALRPGDDD